MSNKIAFIMGDQLSSDLSVLKAINKSKDMVFMCEVSYEATYVKHHKKKLVLIFSAMRHFANELLDQGYKVKYVKLDDYDNSGNFQDELTKLKQQNQDCTIYATEPSEYRVKELLKAAKVILVPDSRFLCTPEEFSNWAQGRKQLRMEYFYRGMRRKYDVLMDGDQPTAGKWNFDSDNRKFVKANVKIPRAKTFPPDLVTKEVIALVEHNFSEHFGDAHGFALAVNRAQALEVLHDFIQNRLNMFGDYQDAMLEGEPWMYHSHISFYLNIGLILPKECIDLAVDSYHKGLVPINSAEGFIRQILGWREYIRGIYWLKMPEYAEDNFLNANRELPSFYWSTQTKMNCLKQCLIETKQNAYAHHIQRLMVLGNFALLYGVKPKAINEWFWIVYADAFQWVELPNVSGMVLFADGGLVASKPYAAGGSYINKMSNYCKNCVYNVKEKTGDTACPFNYLYWDFLVRNRDKLEGNQRIAMMFKTYDKMPEEKKSAIKQSCKEFYEKI